MFTITEGKLTVIISKYLGSGSYGLGSFVMSKVLILQLISL